MGAAEELEELKAENWITVQELASIVGFDRKTIYDWIEQGIVPGVRRFGPRQMRIYKPELIPWLREFATSRSSKR